MGAAFSTTTLNKHLTGTGISGMDSTCMSNEMTLTVHTAKTVSSWRIQFYRDL